MKTIPNLTLKIKETEGGKNATSASLLRFCLAQPPEQGFDFATMRARNRIADVLNKVKAGGEIKLEDADHATAVACVKAAHFSVSHPDLLKFADLFGA